MNFLLSPRDRKTAFKYNIPVPLLQRGMGTIEESNTVVVNPTARTPKGVCEYTPKEAEGMSSACSVEPVEGPEVYGKGSKTPDPKIAVGKIKVEWQK